MKKITIIAAAMLIVSAVSGCGGEVSYKRVEDNVKVGDFLQLGVYDEKPVLWRCVDIDDNGALMLSDKILCIKSFDAAGSDTTGSHGRGYDNGNRRRENGSNYWADSNLRQWLNCETDTVSWDCKNPPAQGSVTYNAYDTEAGFLSEFTKSDLGYIKTVTQKCIIDGYENSPYTQSENAYLYNNTIDAVISNYDTADAETVKDRIFLLDAKQLYKVYTSAEILGADYYVGAPTAEAVEESEYKDDTLQENVKWYSWLRTPNATDLSSVFVKVIAPNGQDTGSLEANDGRIGVRPAFYLNTENLCFTSGSGTDIDPYRLQKVMEDN